MEPITWVILAPFVGILIGIVLRTFYPLYTARMSAIKEGVEPPGFDKQYLLPPLATVALDVGAFAFAAATQPDYLVQFTSLAMIPAIGVGYGLQGFVRETQKLLVAVLK